MSDFQELIKSFPKTREYVRDFFVYGFKTREEFRDKSPRTYDNERRRLESWLGNYVRKDHVSNGANISLAIDSNLLDTNPLFRVWKTKSFTDNDIVLHFLILDLLHDGAELTAEEITGRLLDDYEALFDIQTVRRKCNAYEKEGLLQKKKEGKTVVFSLDRSLADWLAANENMLDALAFYQMAETFGVVGNHLTEQLDHHNHSFRVKHGFCVHTLEDEVLFDLLDAMNRKLNIRLELKSSKNGSVNTADCAPLQIFTSTRSGRRFLCGYVRKSKRFTCYRLDTIKTVTPLEQSAEYEELLSKLDRNREQLWGVSFQGNSRNHLERLTMTIQAFEPSEQYIVNRLKNEGRGGTVTRIARNVYQYEIEVFDCNEMLPWIRTFTGRILSLECTDKSVEQRFYQDLRAMYRIYQIEAE
ncbi:MAG: WYL domain-containing protein [Blautia sp.]|nr:WYL domain-containing protein [Blautia sp.]